MEDLAEVLAMLLQVLAIDKNVVEEDKDKLPEVLREDVIHQVLECSWSIA
jgi:Asp-tRNA(Asn)/Glu-tRNA(Gln) amidotransferase C subunit